MTHTRSNFWVIVIDPATADPQQRDLLERFQTIRHTGRLSGRPQSGLPRTKRHAQPIYAWRAISHFAVMLRVNTDRNGQLAVTATAYPYRGSALDVAVSVQGTDGLFPTEVASVDIFDGLGARYIIGGYGPLSAPRIHFGCRLCLSIFGLPSEWELETDPTLPDQSIEIDQLFVTELDTPSNSILAIEAAQFCRVVQQHVDDLPTERDTNELLKPFIASGYSAKVGQRLLHLIASAIVDTSVNDRPVTRGQSVICLPSTEHVLAETQQYAQPVKATAR